MRFADKFWREIAVEVGKERAAELHLEVPKAGLTEQAIWLQITVKAMRNEVGQFRTSDEMAGDVSVMVEAFANHLAKLRKAALDPNPSS